PDSLLAMSDALPVALIDTIRARLGDRARPGEPLARYTSFRIGGPADLLVLPDTADELAHVLATAAAFGVRLTLLGRRSHGLAGLEYAEGIPGTVGGALFMNAGAYGGELAHAVESVEGLGRDGRALELPGRALVFGYRRSALPPGFVVTAVRLRLRRDEPGRVRNRMSEARARRTAAQPHGKATAGSIFKNPNGDHAGRLIEVAGVQAARAGRS